MPICPRAGGVRNGGRRGAARGKPHHGDECRQARQLEGDAPSQLRRFLSALAAENLAALLAAMLIVAPVAGLRPCRAARWLMLNFPKPARATSPPAASSSATASIVASNAWRAWLGASPVRSATLSARSFLVMFGTPPVWGVIAQNGQTSGPSGQIFADSGKFRATHARAAAFREAPGLPPGARGDAPGS